MNISSISSQNFGAFLMMPPQVNVPPVSAIVRTVDRVQIKSAAKSLPKVNLQSIHSIQNRPANDMFIMHEAVVPDTKIRVVGLPAKSSKQVYPLSKLKGPGRKQITSVWLRK